MIIDAHAHLWKKQTEKVSGSVMFSLSATEKQFRRRDLSDVTALYDR